MSSNSIGPEKSSISVGEGVSATPSKSQSNEKEKYVKHCGRDYRKEIDAKKMWAILRSVAFDEYERYLKMRSLERSAKSSIGNHDDESDNKLKTVFNEQQEKESLIKDRLIANIAELKGKLEKILQDIYEEAIKSPDEMSLSQGENFQLLTSEAIALAEQIRLLTPEEKRKINSAVNLEEKDTERELPSFILEENTKSDPQNGSLTMTSSIEPQSSRITEKNDEKDASEMLEQKLQEKLADRKKIQESLFGKLLRLLSIIIGRGQLTRGECFPSIKKAKVGLKEGHVRFVATRNKDSLTLLYKKKDGIDESIVITAIEDKQGRLLGYKVEKGNFKANFTENGFKSWLDEQQLKSLVIDHPTDVQQKRGPQ